MRSERRRYPCAVGEVATAQQRRSWTEDGWCVLERAVPEEDLAAAQNAVAKLFPSAQQMAAGQEGDELERWRTWDAPWPEFPFRSRSLNRLVLSDLMIDLARDLLEIRETPTEIHRFHRAYEGAPLP